MGFEVPKRDYTGKIREISLGRGDKAVKVGGENAFPFYLFEGEMPNAPRIAMEVYDCPPEEWAAAALEPFEDVKDDPEAYANATAAAVREAFQRYHRPDRMIRIEVRPVAPAPAAESAKQDAPAEQAAE